MVKDEETHACPINSQLGRETGEWMAPDLALEKAETRNDLPRGGTSSLKSHGCKFAGMGWGKEAGTPNKRTIVTP